MKIMELGHIVFYVTDVARMAAFYRDVLGFREIAEGPGMALFSSGRTHHEMLLIEVGGEKREKGIEPGLYHVGFKVGDSHEDLVKVYRELREKGATIIGAADHGVTHSLYIKDPDGNELELYADVSDEWKKNPQAILSPTRPLDLE